ncbi:MAG: hypothetical protein E6J91_20965 [Deltaproteobacteria bacterium]|nr:MAG: hypothetical protein E6J91_20965 [Deltaproteobacteria bacterium]
MPRAPGAGPRDATRGGVNSPALPAKRGRESPLWIEQPNPIGRNPNFGNTTGRYTPAYATLGARLTF